MKLGVYQVVNLEGHVEKGLYGNQMVIVAKPVQFYTGTDWEEPEISRLTYYGDLSGQYSEETGKDLAELGFNGDWVNPGFSVQETLFKVFKNKKGKDRVVLYREKREYERPSEDEIAALDQWWQTNYPTAPSVTAPEDDGADD